MRYKVRAQVGGKLAQIGSRLIDAAAKKLADDFFAGFNARVAVPAVAEEAAGAHEETRPDPAGGRSIRLWIGATVVAIVILIAASYYLS